jgi:hypothetical protein
MVYSAYRFPEKKRFVWEKERGARGKGARGTGKGGVARARIIFFQLPHNIGPLHHNMVVRKELLANLVRCVPSFRPSSGSLLFKSSFSPFPFLLLPH